MDQSSLAPGGASGDASSLTPAQQVGTTGADYGDSSASDNSAVNNSMSSMSGMSDKQKQDYAVKLIQQAFTKLQTNPSALSQLQQTQSRVPSSGASGFINTAGGR